MTDRIKDKIIEIENFLNQLQELSPSDFQEYENDFGKKAACERYCEKIIEAVVDLAFKTIKQLQLKIPEEDKEAFVILEQNNIISSMLSERLQNAKSMRNILAHEYGKVDDKIIFGAVTEELQVDIPEFIRNIEDKINKKDQ